MAVGQGVLVWFMDPLNPDVTLRDTVDGLIVGTLLGSCSVLSTECVGGARTSAPSGLEIYWDNRRRSIAQPVATLATLFHDLKF